MQQCAEHEVCKWESNYLKAFLLNIPKSCTRQKEALWPTQGPMPHFFQPAGTAFSALLLHIYTPSNLSHLRGSYHKPLYAVRFLPHMALQHYKRQNRHPCAARGVSHTHIERDSEARHVLYSECYDQKLTLLTFLYYNTVHWFCRALICHHYHINVVKFNILLVSISWSLYHDTSHVAALLHLVLPVCLSVCTEQ